MSDKGLANTLIPVCEGAQLFCSPQGNILFGCPPEILKFILRKKLPMPETVVLPAKLHHQCCSQSMLEFPFYHFLFVQRGPDRQHAFRVLAHPQQCEHLSEMMRITIYGPSKEEMIQAGTKPDVAEQLKQELDYLAIKSPNEEKPYKLEEIMHFIPLEEGKEVQVCPEKNDLKSVKIMREGDATYQVFYGGRGWNVDISIKSEQMPPYKIKHQALQKNSDQNQIIALGSSNGFDPDAPANGYIFQLKEKLLLWDSPSYLSEHLKALKLTLDDIDAMVLSHVHEDHIDVVQCVCRSKPLDLYATAEVYYSLLIKLMAVFDCSMEKAKTMHNFHLIEPDLKPQNICGAQFSFFHSVHPIPTIGMRLELSGNDDSTLHLSGDHLSHASLDKIYQSGSLSEARYQMFKNFPNGKEQLVIVDVGGGLIHGDFRDHLKLPTPVAFMHTSLIPETLPQDKFLLQPGQRIKLG